MKRGIILAMEEYEGADPNDFDFSDFESVMGSDVVDLTTEIDNTVDAVDDVLLHDEITEIIATEGMGNRPQIAAIALSALETRLFGKPIIVPRVGTESNTRVATEGKNIFKRAWAAIVKFFKKLWNKIKSIFTGDKKKKTKKKAKAVKDANVDAAIEALPVLEDPAVQEVIEQENPTKQQIEQAVKNAKNGGEAIKATSIVTIANKMRKDVSIHSLENNKLRTIKDIVDTLPKATQVINGIDASIKGLVTQLDKVMSTADAIIKNGGSGNSDELKGITEKADQLKKITMQVLQEVYVPGYKMINGKEIVPLAYEEFRKQKQEKIVETLNYMLTKKDQISADIDKIAEFQTAMDKHSDQMKIYEGLTSEYEAAAEKAGDGSKEAMQSLLSVFKAMMSYYSTLTKVAGAYFKFSDQITLYVMSAAEIKG